MDTTIFFRVIENNKKIGDTQEIPIQITKDRIISEDFIIQKFNETREFFPKAEILIICETKHRESYIPMTQLLKGDIEGLIKRSDIAIKQGILYHQKNK